MKIRKLSASFGKLENESLSFHEGLNIIYAPNESGKSTWCAFIRAMLYGIDTGERAKAGFLPDKLRYAPWSGALMEGSMDLTARDCDITITRTTRLKSAPMREFSAVYSGTNTPVEGMDGSNAGQQLTGVNREVFRRSAFIEQGSVAVKGSPELEKRISAIVTTGEEQTSCSEAEERLRTWQRKRRWNRRGFLPDLEGRMDETQRLLGEMEGASDTLERMEQDLIRTQEDCVRLESQVTEARRRQRKEALERLNAGRAALKESSEAHDRALTTLSQQRDEIRQTPFGDRDSRELVKQIDTDLQVLEQLDQSAQPGRGLVPAILCFLLAAVAAGFYTVYSLLPLIIGAGVLCLGAVVLLFRWSKANQTQRLAEETRRKILKKYRAASPEDIRAIRDRRLQLQSAADQSALREQKARAVYEQLRQQQELLESEALAELDFTGGDSEAARLGRELTAARGEALRLSQQLASLKGRLSAMGDPLILRSELGRMQEEYDQIQGEYDAIVLAQEALHQADTEIQSRFSPELGKLAAQYMAMVTGGKYEDVLLDRDFSARTRRAGDTVARDSEYLSAGTLDLMYLAVRLAVCELALPDGEPCPLILDDALVNLDPERYDQAIELLKQIARERQVILFTCREGKSAIVNNE